MDENKLRFATLASHAGNGQNQWQGGVYPSNSSSSALNQDGPNESHDSITTGNSSQKALEARLAAIEGAKYACAYASGCGVACAVMSLLSSGDHLLTSQDIYGGTSRLINSFVSRMGVKVSYADFCDLKTIKTEINNDTKMIWIETPSNPLMKIVDIAGVVAVARTQPNIIVVVDNTFLTPYFQRPLDLGADISMYSISKYMNGHSDVIMGSVAVNDAALAEKLRVIQNSMGIIPSPFDCYLVRRSLTTLALRLEQHQKNGLAVANWLKEHPDVIDVMHPGLHSHPQHELGRRQTTGHFGVLSFRHRGGWQQTSALVSALRLYILAEGLGGYESMANLPCIMSHGSVPDDIKKKLGITENLIRLSTGIEDISDIIADLDQAFKSAFGNQ
ncbi:cystathionine gamma-lyase-like [Pectinophora gossypiella]|uniref:cystathionine gamma-lyase-like n=1 Tax=Pectinophora gossypiella TaxID=13191 RepID=UPI00214F48DB|nr:cystathionine gamma-lyase-like [Pectinophora gossypiella]